MDLTAKGLALLARPGNTVLNILSEASADLGEWYLGRRGASTEAPADTLEVPIPRIEEDTLPSFAPLAAPARFLAPLLPGQSQAGPGNP